MKITWFYMALIVLLFACGSSKEAPLVNVEQVVKNEPNRAYIAKFHEGLQYKQMGMVDEAIASFESCLTIKTDDDAVYYALSQLYLSKKELTKSAEAIKKALELDPGNKWYLQEFGFMQFESGKYKEAAKTFEKLSKMEPNNHDWLLSQGEALLQAGDFSGAVKVLDRLEQQLGPNPEMSVEKFRLYRQIKQDEKAVEELNKALEHYPSDAQLLAHLVDYYFEKKQDEKAFSYLIKLAESDPGNGNAHMALAQYYDHQGKRKESYEELKKAFVCDDISLDVKIKVLLSMFDTQTKLDPEMFELADLLLANEKTDARIYTLRGDFYMKDGQEKKALKEFQEALKYDKTKYIIWEQALLMEYRNRDFEALYRDGKECLTYFPSVGKVYVLFGVAAVQEKKYAEAIEVLTTGEQLIGNDAGQKSEIYAQLGEAHFALKSYQEGKTYYEKALALTPTNQLIKNNFAYRLASAQMELEKAESLVKQVLEADPTDPNYLDTYGWVLFQQKKYKEAEKHFLEALNIDNNNKHIIEHLGDAVFMLGKQEEGLRLWKKAQELGATHPVLLNKIEKKKYYEPVY